MEICSGEEFQGLRATEKRRAETLFSREVDMGTEKSRRDTPGDKARQVLYYNYAYSRFSGDSLPQHAVN